MLVGLCERGAFLKITGVWKVFYTDGTHVVFSQEITYLELFFLRQMAKTYDGMALEEHLSDNFVYVTQTGVVNPSSQAADYLPF